MISLGILIIEKLRSDFCIFEDSDIALYIYRYIFNNTLFRAK